MAAKRYLEESDNQRDEHQPSEKRRARTDISLASVIERVLMVNNMQLIVAAIEPMIRRVVCEEIEDGLRRRSFKLTKSPSLRLQRSSLRLAFSTNLSLPIFTDTKISTIDGTPLRILLLDSSSSPTASSSLSLRIKLQLLVLDGDFPRADTWTTDEFNRKIVKERAGKRRLLAGEMNLSMRDGVVAVGDLEFTDNSSWIRSRKFRIGVRVAPGSNNCGGMKISEGFTDAFIVKDHRGELYKKHHPPMLEDEVWRLEKIGKGGAFDRKLASEGIRTVQDFLRLYVRDQAKLRKILGVNMSDKMWNVTINHAEKCVMGNKQYLYHLPNCSITFNPIFQIISAQIDGKLYYASDLHGRNKAYVENLAKTAYKNWESLEIVEEEGLVNSGSLMLTHGHRRHNDDSTPMSNQQMSVATVPQFQHQQQQLLLHDASYEMSSSGLLLGDDSQMVTATGDNWINNYETLLYEDPGMYTRSN